MLSRYRHADAKGDRKYTSYSFFISALPDGVSGQRRTLSRALPLGKGPPVPIGWEAGWPLELVCSQRVGEKSFASARDLTPVVQSVAGIIVTQVPQLPVQLQVYKNKSITHSSFCH
jgi:hypothetical protein